LDCGLEPVLIQRIFLGETDRDDSCSSSISGDDAAAEDIHPSCVDSSCETAAVMSASCKTLVEATGPTSAAPSFAGPEGPTPGGLQNSEMKNESL